MWVLVPTDEILFFARIIDMDVVNGENAVPIGHKGQFYAKAKRSKRNPPSATYILLRCSARHQRYAIYRAMFQLGYLAVHSKH